MKKYISHIMMVLLSVLVLSSCNREVLRDCNYGYLGISLDNDLSADVVTKAEGDMVFAIDVLKEDGTKVAGRDNHLTTIEEPIELPVGSYYVEARSGELLNAAFNAPYYEGRTPDAVKIRPERTTETTVNCALANTIFSVQFEGDFSMYTEYEIHVTNGVGSALVLSSNPDAGNVLEAGFDAKAYFAVTGTLKWELFLTNTDGGTYHAEDTYSNVMAKEHYNLVFSRGEDQTSDGALILKVGIDNKWSDSVLDLEMNFASKDHLSIIANDAFGAESGKVVSFAEGTETEKVLTLTAAEGVKSIMVTHDNDALYAAAIPRGVELVSATSNTLAMLANAGFVVADDFSTINLTELFKTVPAGMYEITFILEDRTEVSKVFTLCVEIYEGAPTIDVATLDAKAGWAGMAQLNGSILEPGKEDVITFQYRRSDSPVWIEVDKKDVQIDAAGDTYSAIIKGLAASTTYQFRAVSKKYKEAEIKSFTTAAAATIHNMNFDIWTENNKYPNSSDYSKKDKTGIWDSANSTGLLTTTTPVDDAVSGKAARLESLYKFSMFAAGNIFTGVFQKASISGGIGAELDWGTPFTGRPLALRGYYKYAPKVVDHAEEPYSYMMDQTDECQILICLTSWDAPFRVNTASGDFVDFTDSAIIAFNQFNTAEASSEYIRFTLPLVYNYNDVIPSYLVIAAASSRYGDYFTGAVGSVLHIDEFELVYDPAELTEEEYNLVFSKVEPF